MFDYTKVIGKWSVRIDGEIVGPTYDLKESAEMDVNFSNNYLYYGCARGDNTHRDKLKIWENIVHIRRERGLPV